jgi:hypothetical protein
MPRAYLRLDPAFDERKAHYPDGPYAALVATICLAELQPQRGRFRSAGYLRALLGKRGRHVPYLLEHGDLIDEGGRLYLDGWDEWQEGDWKVAERVARIRNRRGNGPTEPPRNAGGNGASNGSSNGPDSYIPLERSAGAGEALAAAEQPALLPEEEEPEWEAIVWLARHGCHLQPHSGFYKAVVLAVEQHGINAYVGMLDRLASAGTKSGDAKGFVFGAKDALDAQTRPNLKALETEDRDEERQEAWANRVVATKVRSHDNGLHVEPNPGCPRCSVAVAR